MLFYLSLFVAILLAAIHARFFYTVIVNKSRSGHSSNRRVAITDSTRRNQKERTGFKISGDSRTPSVQGVGLVSSNQGRKHPANPVVYRNLKSARLIHEERLSSMNESHKTRRSEESEHLTLDMVSKPFTRKVAPWAKDNRSANKPWETQKCPVKIAEPTYSELARTESRNTE